MAADHRGRTLWAPAEYPYAILASLLELHDDLQQAKLRYDQADQTAERVLLLTLNDFNPLMKYSLYIHNVNL